MKIMVSSLRGLPIHASDGRVGKVADLLFDETTWHVRWFVIRTASWLMGGRTVLIHPSAVERLDSDAHMLNVGLTKRQLEDSPDILLDEPVSRQIEYGIRGERDWDPAWGNPRFVAGVLGGLGICVSKRRLNEEASMHKTPRGGGPNDQGDPRLQSVFSLIGKHVWATDDSVGYLVDVCVDNTGWSLEYFLADIRTWLRIHPIIIPPSAITTISWPDQEIRLHVRRSSLKKNLS